jgi:hypothetical protein
MDRRDFTKLCASTAIAAVVLDKTAAGSVGKPGESNPASSNPEHLDAYVRREGMTWILGTSKAERRITLHNDHLLLTSFINKISGREYRDSGPDPCEIRMKVDGADVCSPTWAWVLVDEQIHRLSQGEIQLDIQLKGGPIQATKHWLVYPGTPIVREWMTFENVSGKDVHLEDVFFLNTQLLGKRQDRLELDYLTGGANFNGSQTLKTEQVSSTYNRTFDSRLGVAGIHTWNDTANSLYLPLVLLRDSRTADNLAIGWDYLGHWSLHAVNSTNGGIAIDLKIEGYDAHIKPGAIVETPQAFAAAISGNLDEIGNQILDWQYQYLWDFTNPDYFGKTRWTVDLSLPWWGNGGTPSAELWGQRLALDLRYVDLLRESGGDILWDDAGWYDYWGNWNGPDWRQTTDYLKKYGMLWLLWFPTFLATEASTVAQKHPEWMDPGNWWFDQSIPATESWQKELLDANVAKWGDFQWRYDIAPAASANDTTALAADQNLRKLIREFKTSNPKSGVDACDDGGRWLSYDLARFADSGECTDGGVGPYGGYYSSLFIPPDKLHNGEFSRIYYNKARDRAHLTMDPDRYQDPGNGPDVECVRKDWEIYHYLISKGVAGRGSHVFRPRVVNDDPIWYFQRMDKAGHSGIIISKHSKTGPEYFLVSKPLSNFSEDHYEGGPIDMVQVVTSNIVTSDTGIYADPIDKEYRYYGFPGEIFGPLSFRYSSARGEESYVRHVAKSGAVRKMDTPFFGMAFQMGSEPVTISELGQFDFGANRGTYLLEIIRAEDKKVIGSATLDMSRAKVDPLGFKWVKLSTPSRLEPGPEKPVVIFPGGLQPAAMYDVRTCESRIQFRQTGAELMKNGISLPSVPPGELIFLNLPNYPGSKTDHIPPTPPSNVTKRIGTNLGTQGVEIAWSPGQDNHWISYYEVLKDGSVIGKSAKGNFFFDHAPGSRQQIASKYEVRTVDGDENRSPLATASAIAGDPETHQPQGEFSPTQGSEGWKYEQAFSGNRYEDLVWNSGGREGFWAGSGLGRIGRIWAQPSAAANIARTFVVPKNCALSLSGQIQMDPSATHEAPVFVRIEQNGKQLWPQSDWMTVPQFGSPISYQIENIEGHKGDAIRFVLKCNYENVAQPVIWNPLVVIHE